MDTISAQEAQEKFLRYYERAGSGQPVEIVAPGHHTVYLIPKEMLKEVNRVETPMEKKATSSWGALRGSVISIDEDFDNPLDESMWDACQ